MIGVIVVFPGRLQKFTIISLSYDLFFLKRMRIKSVNFSGQKG